MALSKEINPFHMAERMLNDETLGNSLDLWTKRSNKWKRIRLVILRSKGKAVFEWSYKGKTVYNELGYFGKVFIGNPEHAFGEEEEDDAIRVFFS